MPFLPLLSLALATFAIGVTEFATQGLLLEIAADLHVGVPQVGLLVTGYALGVAIGGPVVTVLTVRLPRKAALLGLLGIFILGNLLCAVAPTYPLLMAARIVTSLCHGAFFGIGSLVAAGLAKADRQASAVALMWAGIAASNILGVPAGTALGHAFGWRSAFWGVAGIGLIAACAMALLLPGVRRVQAPEVVKEFRVLAQPQLLLALALTVLISAATFSVFTYIAPLLVEVTGVASPSLPCYLLLFGVGGVIGMQFGARFADRHLAASIAVIFGANALVYLALPTALANPALAMAAIFLWGLVFFAIAAPIQVRVVGLAGEAPNLASTLVQSGFNLGNALGPLLGGAALSATLGYGTLPRLAANLAGAGVLIALLSIALERRAGRFCGLPRVFPDIPNDFRTSPESR